MKKIVILLFVGLLLFGSMIPKLINIFRKDDEVSTISNNPTNAVPNEPLFVKEGELVFLKNNKQLTIEVVDNEAETTQGLMYRKSMPDSCGMLFVFPDSQERSFWMKNTYIPLDILYLDSQKQILTIQANRTPFSEEAIPSLKEAQYVLEVNAGYCQRNGIQQGDKVDFKIQ